MQTLDGIEIHARPETCCLIDAAVIHEGVRYCSTHARTKLRAKPAAQWNAAHGETPEPGMRVGA